MKLQNNRNTLKVLVLGDVIGRCGRQAVLQSIQQLKKNTMLIYSWLMPKMQPMEMV